MRGPSFASQRWRSNDGLSRRCEGPGPHPDASIRLEGEAFSASLAIPAPPLALTPPQAPRPWALSALPPTSLPPSSASRSAAPSAASGSARMSAIGWPMAAILPRSMAVRATGAVARNSGASSADSANPGQRAGELRRDHDKGRPECDADRACRAAPRQASYRRPAGEVAASARDRARRRAAPSPATRHRRSRQSAPSW